MTDKKELMVSYFLNRFKQVFDVDDTDQVENIFRETLEQVGGNLEQEKKRKKRTRNISGYNIYVTEQLKTMTDTDISHSSKLSVIGGRWGRLSEEDKEYYNDIAKVKNREKAEKQKTANVTVSTTTAQPAPDPPNASNTADGTGDSGSFTL